LFPLWQRLKHAWKRETARASTSSTAELIRGLNWTTRIIVIVSIIAMVAIPIVLVTVGFDLEALANEEYIRATGYLGVFFITFLSSTTILFPAPGVLVVMVAASLFNPNWVALAATLGGALGEFTSYLVGYAGAMVIELKRSQRYRTAENWMRRWGSATIFAFALAPFLPFDLVGIAAGSLRYPFSKFMLATIAGRLPRSFMEAYLGWAIVPYFIHF
jgi:membrane protein YqaA with SNARE-associated domain